MSTLNGISLGVVLGIGLGSIWVAFMDPWLLPRKIGYPWGVLCLAIAAFMTFQVWH